VKSNLLNRNHIDYSTEPLFFGSGRNIVRLDVPGDPFLLKQVDRQRGMMWFAQDYSYAQDAIDFANMSPELQELFMANLKLQQLYDSLVARSVIEVFAPVTTSPVLEQWWQLHSYFESIHYDSYATLIKALPVNATAIFDDIMINPHIIARAEQIADTWDTMVKYNSAVNLGEMTAGSDETKRQLILSLYALNILEAVLFQTSFLVTWAFAENGMMETSAKAMGKIAMDEGVHCAVSIYLLNTLRNSNEYAYLFAELESQVIDMYKHAYEADFEWIDYIFSFDAQLLGLNANSLKQYAQYNINLTMRQLGLDPIVESIPNPCIWADKYKSLANVQSALNETDGSSYLLGKLDKTINWEEVYAKLDN